MVTASSSPEIVAKWFSYPQSIVVESGNPVREEISTGPRDVIERPHELEANVPGSNDTFLLTAFLNKVDANVAANDAHGDVNVPHDVETSDEVAEANISTIGFPARTGTYLADAKFGETVFVPVPSITTACTRKTITLPKLDAVCSISDKSTEVDKAPPKATLLFNVDEMP
jgi:hypothetical protein|tara:strand:- start:113 stop:625 length:513 start_codon:yes stop_codon:yes gene_type:complete